MTVKFLMPFVHHDCHWITSPTGFSNPNSLAVASLITKADESLARSLEKSLPARNCQPKVVPYSGVTVIVANSGMKPGSRPFQSKPPFELHTSVGGPDDSAISVIAP